jgi:DNA ligase 1
MAFVPPQLCTEVSGRSWLTVPGYVAEPKLDGQRIQLHGADRRTVAAFARPGHDLLLLAGLAWLRTVTWPVADAIFDGELCAELGIEGFKPVRAERAKANGVTMVACFDALAAEGESYLARPWIDRRRRLAELLTPLPNSRLRLVPTTTNATRLWDQWTAWGGEGIVLKDPAAPHRPGERTRAW